MSRPWPRMLRFSRQNKALHITFDDGAAYDLTYTYLRSESPSAEVQGHGGGPKPQKPHIDPDIDVERAEPVGRYAVRLIFSDGHSGGLYTWNWLYDLGQKQARA